MLHYLAFDEIFFYHYSCKYLKKNLITLKLYIEKYNFFSDIKFRKYYVRAWKQNKNCLYIKTKHIFSSFVVKTLHLNFIQKLCISYIYVIDLDLTP